MSNNWKDTNPKDALGTRKAPLSTVPLAVVSEVGVAFMEGGRKYGRHNFRAIGVRASVYVDAAWRHLKAFWEHGQDVDPDSGLHHITKAIASLMVLRDSQLCDNWVDDRPPSIPEKHLKYLQERIDEVFEKYPDVAVPPYTIHWDKGAPEGDRSMSRAVFNQMDYETPEEFRERFKALEDLNEKLLAGPRALYYCAEHDTNLSPGTSCQLCDLENK